MPGLTHSIGSLLVGSWFSIAMFGGMTFQAARFLRINSDRMPWLKALVTVLWILDCLHVVFTCHSLYWYLIVNEAEEPAVSAIPWSLAGTIAITAAITLLVQLFFSRRIWILSRELRIVVVLIVLTALARVSFACVTTSKAIIIGNLPDFAPLIPFLVTTGLTLSVVTDFLVTGSLCWYLSRQRTGFRTDSLIDKIMRWTVQNGAITSFFGLLSIITAVAMPHNLVWLGIHLIISKCYTTSTIAHLNAREDERLERAAQNERDHGLHLRNNSGSGDSTTKGGSGRQPSVAVHVQKEIFIERSTEKDNDNDSTSLDRKRSVGSIV